MKQKIADGTWEHRTLGDIIVSHVRGEADEDEFIRRAYLVAREFDKCGEFDQEWQLMILGIIITGEGREKRNEA